jgi:hypothetical protein
LSVPQILLRFRFALGMSSNEAASQKPKAVFECKLWSDKYKSTDYTTRIRQVGRYVHFSVLRPRSMRGAEAANACKTVTERAFGVANRKRAVLTPALKSANAGDAGALALSGERKPHRIAPAGQRSRCVPLGGNALMSRKRISADAGACNSTSRRRTLSCKLLCDACRKPHEEAVGACASQEGSTKCGDNPKPEADSSGSIAVAIGQRARDGVGNEAKL